MKPLTRRRPNDVKARDSSICTCTISNEQQRTDAREYQQGESQTIGQCGQALTVSPSPIDCPAIAQAAGVGSSASNCRIASAARAR